MDPGYTARIPLGSTDADPAGILIRIVGGASSVGRKFNSKFVEGKITYFISKPVKLVSIVVGTHDGSLLDQAPF